MLPGAQQIPDTRPEGSGRPVANGSAPEQCNTKTDRRHDMSDRVREKFTTQVRLATLSAVRQIALAEGRRRYEPIRYGWKQGAAHFWPDARDLGGAWFVDKLRVNDLHPTMNPVKLRAGSPQQFEETGRGKRSPDPTSGED